MCHVFDQIQFGLFLVWYPCVYRILDFLYS